MRNMMMLFFFPLCAIGLQSHRELKIQTFDGPDKIISKISDAAESVSEAFCTAAEKLAESELVNRVIDRTSPIIESAAELSMNLVKSALDILSFMGPAGLVLGGVGHLAFSMLTGGEEEEPSEVETLGIEIQSKLDLLESKIDGLIDRIDLQFTKKIERVEFAIAELPQKLRGIFRIELLKHKMNEIESEIAAVSDGITRYRTHQTLAEAQDMRYHSRSLEVHLKYLESRMADINYSNMISDDKDTSEQMLHTFVMAQRTFIAYQLCTAIAYMNDASYAEQRMAQAMENQKLMIQTYSEKRGFTLLEIQIRNHGQSHTDLDHYAYVTLQQSVINLSRKMGEWSKRGNGQYLLNSRELELSLDEVGWYRGYGKRVYRNIAFQSELICDGTRRVYKNSLPSRVRGEYFGISFVEIAYRCEQGTRNLVKRCHVQRINSQLLRRKDLALANH